MAENDNDTTTTADGTQSDDASASADAGQAASGAADEDVSVLRSRYAGQTAKVGELTGQLTAKDKLIAELQGQLKDAQEGKLTADEAAQALVKAKDQEIEAERRQRRVERIETRFPETYSELGESAFALSDEKLAAMEARLTGTASEEPPTPRGQNAARSAGQPAGKTDAEKSSADILAELEAMPLPDEWRT